MEFFSEKEFKGKLGNIEDKKSMYVYSFLNFFICIVIELRYIEFIYLLLFLCTYILLKII